MTAGARTRARYPELVASVMQSAASDYMAIALARTYGGARIGAGVSLLLLDAAPSPGAALARWVRSPNV